MAPVAAWLALHKKTDESLAKNLGHKIAFRRAVAIAFGGIYFLPQIFGLNCSGKFEMQPYDSRRLALRRRKNLRVRRRKKLLVVRNTRNTQRVLSASGGQPKKAKKSNGKKIVVWQSDAQIPTASFFCLRFFWLSSFEIPRNG